MVKEKFVQKIGIEQNVYVQVNPIDSNNILELSREELKFDKKENELIVCAVGRLEPVKAYDRLLEVHKRLIDESIHHKIWIVGDGSQRDNLESYVKKHRLEETVTLWGYQENPYKYIKNADIYICSSIVEGLSSTALEATFLEKVIVSTDCPGMEEILGENNENALIVKNDTEGIYEGLKEILTNKELRNRYQENIKKRCKLFNLETTMKQIEKIIDE